MMDYWLWKSFVDADVAPYSDAGLSPELAGHVWLGVRQAVKRLQAELD